MTQKVVSVLLNAIVGPYQAAMGRAAATTKGFGTAVQGANVQTGGLTRSTGMLAPKLIGAAGLAFALKEVASSAISWESAFAGVRKTVNGTPEELDAINRGLRELSTNLPTSAEELAAIAESAGQLGIETGKVVEFTEIIAALGETTNLAGQQGATELARFANIVQMSQDDFDRLGSTVVSLGNNFETTEAEIVQMGLRLAAAGNIAGLSEADILAFAAALTSVGVEAEAGGTAMSKVFMRINDAVIDGSDNLDRFAETSGMSAQAFAQAFRDDPAAAVAEFIAGLARINEAGGSTSALFEELELNDERLKRALLSTAEAGDILTEAIDNGNEAFEQNVALQDEMNQRLDTTASKLSMAGNQIAELVRKIGGPIGDLTGLGAEAVGFGFGFVNAALDEITGAELTDAAQQRLDDHLDSIQLGGSFADFGPGGNPATITLPAIEFEQSEQVAAEGAELFLGSIATGATVATGAVEEFGEAQRTMSAWVEDANGNLVHQIELFRDQYADPVTTLVRALEDVQQAQESYNEAVAEYGTTSDEAKDAGLTLFEAIMDSQIAADMAAGKYGNVVNALEGMRAAGLLTSQQVASITLLLDEARVAAEQYEGTYTAEIGLHIDPQVWADLRELGRLIEATTGRTDVAITGTPQGGFLERAAGGPFGAGDTMLVGEEGPELVQFGRSGHVIPAPETAAALSSGTRFAGGQVNVSPGAVQLVVRDEQKGMSVATRELTLMSLGYV